MSGAHETLEHAEHAAHAEGHGGGNNKIFGVTMALIGVLIAFSAAMLGSARNELTRAMIEQTQAHSDYTSASTKLRLIMIELEKQRARVVAAKDVPGGWSPVERFIELSMDYSSERNLAKNWADSYRPLVDAHFDAAESYETAQVIAEIGIVLASLAVLLASRSAWMLSILLALACGVQLGRTYFPTQRVVKGSLEKVHHAEEAYVELRKAHVGANEDEKAIERLDPDGKIRAAIAERAKTHRPATPESDGKKEPAH